MRKAMGALMRGYASSEIQANSGAEKACAAGVGAGTGWAAGAADHSNRAGSADVRAGWAPVRMVQDIGGGDLATQPPTFVEQPELAAQTGVESADTGSH